jgi:hypothetical protein
MLPRASLQYWLQYLPFSTRQLHAGWAHFFFSSAMTYTSFGFTITSWATEMPAGIWLRWTHTRSPVGFQTRLAMGVG